MIRISKKRYFSDKFNNCKNDVKRTWSIINGILHTKNNKSPIPDALKFGSNIIHDPKQIANAFNDFFVNVGPTLASNIHSNTTAEQYLNDANPTTLFMTPTDESKIYKVALSCLKPNKSADYDNVKPSILRKVIHFIVKPLAYIINLSLHNGIVPDHLKIAKVIPIYKKGDPKASDNYRPVSVLSCFSKIFERIVYNRIHNFINKNNVMYKGQYGFRPGHSTELALTDAMDRLCDAMDKKMMSVGVFLDLSKAFDTIDHQILSMKLSHYGIRGVGLNWIKSYLSNRVQITTFNNVYSKPMNMLCGVPQGSILGPLHFILYVNDIYQVSDKCSTILFADDTNIFFTGHNPSVMKDTICHELTKLYAWFSANKLSLNVSKTNYIVFNNKKGNCNINFDIKMDGKSLKRVDYTTFLGVIIDSGLTWNNHVKFIATKIARGVGILSKLKHLLPKQVLRSLYFTLIYPHLTVLHDHLVWYNVI